MVRTIILLSVLLAVGCTKHGGNLVFRDQAGKIVASGDLDWPRKPGSSIDGDWRMRFAEEGFPKLAEDKGKFHAEIEAKNVTIDLDPGTNDNNLVLRGLLGDDRITGDWSHNTFAGPREKGKFVWIKNRPDTPALTTAD